MFTLCFGLALVAVAFSAPANEVPAARQPRSSCNCECGVGSRQSRVVGGTEANPHEFPWMAWLSQSGKFYCGASLITNRHILTAAHCVNGIDMATVKVTLADHDRESTTSEFVITRKVKSWKTHASFNSVTYNNDIAILELDDPVHFDETLRPACLPMDGSTEYSGRVAIMSGWGRMQEFDEKLPGALRKLSLPVWKRQECLDAGYPQKKITENMFCAGYPDGKMDACQGDSGGPLHMADDKGTMEIIGIVSWGRGCARPQLPGIYTKVGNYLSWIQESLNGECVCSHPKSR